MEQYDNKNINDETMFNLNKNYMFIINDEIEKLQNKDKSCMINKYGENDILEEVYDFLDSTRIDNMIQ